MKSKVLVGSPIIAEKKYKRYCLNDYLEALPQLTYPNKDFMLLLNGKDGDNLIAQHPHLNIQRTPTKELPVETVVIARNTLREEVLRNGFDYLLFLEQDIVPPLDIVERLLQHEKGICSALYFNETPKKVKRHGVDTTNYPMVWYFDPQSLANNAYNEKLIDPQELLPGRLMQVDACGLGTVIIHRSVLENLVFRFIPGNPPIFEEFCFGRDCKERDMPIYLDSSLICKHYSSRDSSNGE